MGRPIGATDIWARPEWAMIGVHWPHPPDRPCMLVASNYWSQGELSVRWHPVLFFDDRYLTPSLAPEQWQPPPEGEVTLKTDDARKMIFIQAATWQECIKALFEQWQPETSQRGIEGKKAITDG